MKLTIMNISRKMTATEAIKRMIVYRLGKAYDAHFYSAAVQYCEFTDMWDFAAESAKVSVRGYVGCLGQIVVTWKDGEQLELREFEEI